MRLPPLPNRERATKKLWRVMEDSSTKTRNVTYDRFVFFSSIQQQGESVENFYGRLTEQAADCCLGDEETTRIRDAFIVNMQDHDTQRGLLKETVSPTKALEIAIHLEMGSQNQQKINQNLNTNAQSVNIVNSFQEGNSNANYQQSRKDFTRYRTVLQNYQCTSICPKFLERWSHNHHQICPANGKKRKNCGSTGHFAKKCRKPKKSQSQTPKPRQTNINQINTNTIKSDNEDSVNYITSYQQLYDQVYESNYDSDSDDYVTAVSSDPSNQLEPLNAKIKLETSWQVH